MRGGPKDGLAREPAAEFMKEESDQVICRDQKFSEGIRNNERIRK